MKTNLLLLQLLGIVLFSCTTDEAFNCLEQTVSNTDAYITVIDTCTIVDARKAKNVAQLFQKNNPLSRSVSIEKEVESISDIKDENGKILLFVVNYKNNQGFVIVSATQDYSPVLAYSDDGHFDFDEVGLSGISVWLSEQKKIISSINEIPDSVKRSYRAQWVEYNKRKEKIVATRSSDDVLSFINKCVREWESEGYTVYRFSDIKDTPFFDSMPIEFKTQVHNAMDSADPRYGGRSNVTFILEKNNDYIYKSKSPLLQTTWDQENGYNYYIPNKYPVGCVAVAMGQIMKYHEYPLRYDWNSMYNTEPTVATAAFLLEIGINVDMNYSPNGSGSNIDKALSAFKNKYGYVSSKKIAHSAYIVMDELDQFRPVYMRGDASTEGHAWVCDGYEYSYYRNKRQIVILEDTSYNGSEPNEMSYLDSTIDDRSHMLFFHMNWGWGSSHDGFYADNNLQITDFSKGPLDLSHGRYDLVNIYPSK